MKAKFKRNAKIARALPKHTEYNPGDRDLLYYDRIAEGAVLPVTELTEDYVEVLTNDRKTGEEYKQKFYFKVINRKTGNLYGEDIEIIEE